MLPRLRYKQVVLALIGLLLVGGILLLPRLTASNATVEVVEAQATPSVATASATLLVAEISGEVENPGVYKLEIGARVDDLLKASGGVKETADNEWIERFINKAAKLTDGQKIVIPSASETPLVQQQQVLSASTTGEGAGYQTTSPPQIQTPSNSLININTASKSKLEELWGIGPVTAQKIIDQRPYSATDELIKKKIVKSNVWERIKNEISVY